MAATLHTFPSTRIIRRVTLWDDGQPSATVPTVTLGLPVPTLGGGWALVDAAGNVIATAASVEELTTASVEAL
jgi:hypothetical protein